MAIASEMRELAQDITSSRKDRVHKVGEIRGEAKQVRGETQDLIGSFQTSRNQVGVRLRKEFTGKQRTGNPRSTECLKKREGW